MLTAVPNKVGNKEVLLKFWAKSCRFSSQWDVYPTSRIELQLQIPDLFGDFKLR